MDNSTASQGNFSMHNGNGYKYLLAIDKADKMIQGSSKALANNTQYNHVRYTLFSASSL